MRFLVSIVSVVLCAPALAQPSTSNVRTESQQNAAPSRSTVVAGGTGDLHADRTVEVIAAQTSHGYEGWMIPSRMPSVWIDTGEGPGCVQSIRVRIADARSRAHAIRALSSMSLVIETDTYRTASVPLIDLVPGRGDVLGAWPVQYDADTLTVNITLKMPYRFLMRIGFQLQGDSAVAIDAQVMTSEYDDEQRFVRLVNLATSATDEWVPGRTVIEGAGQIEAAQFQSHNCLEDVVWTVDGQTVPAQRVLFSPFDNQIVMQRITPGSGHSSASSLRGVVVVRVDSLQSDH